jgi:hypothetical protein
MVQRFVGHLTYANVVATVALFVALGGGAYAALRLPRNSVGTAQLKNNAVTPRKVKNALTLNDLAPGQVAQLRGPPGTTGATGAMGQTGPKGDTGAVGPSQGFGAAAAAGAFVNGSPNSDNLLQATFVTTSPGRLLVTVRGHVTITCTASGEIDGGLYVDGTHGLAGSGQILVNSGTSFSGEINDFGITSQLSPGSHTVAYKPACVAGTTTSPTIGGGDAALAAVLTGS